MQCASSMAKKLMVMRPRVSMNHEPPRRSGAIYKIFTDPACSAFRISFCWENDWELLKNAAAMPLDNALSTWSFISEIRGLITTQVPASMQAGNW